MRHLFKELNYDSHKNIAYVSLGADTAKLADELYETYKDKPFTKKKGISKLYTLRSFIDSISDYMKLFTSIHTLLEDLESKQRFFISQVDFTKHYVEESECITSNFILPLTLCNFIPYLHDTTILPEYHGKNKPIPKTISLTLKTQVWATHVGIEHGTTICPVCKVRTIEQISFHCGHVKAKSKGGQNTIDNLRPICQSCNSSMGTTDMEEFIHLVR
jgi:hypothetical protein